ncbi:Dbl homology domain-containing protein [Ilyonectria sp. MPI-CAGE-AT-0026]|nr:Dbl homology domain-containing protein [Ilyonectria sp. MPI-CAGE-AT-0026]
MAAGTSTPLVGSLATIPTILTTRSARSTSSASSTASTPTTPTTPTHSPWNSDPLIDTSNVTKQEAETAPSLYQQCIALRQRLSQVPGFDPFLERLDCDGPLDPIYPLWNLFRTGHSLLAIYNSLHPAKELTVESSILTEAEKSKIAVIKFIRACGEELNISLSDTFGVADLMGDDTNDFVKVIHTINFVLNLAASDYLKQLQSNPEDRTLCLNTGSQMAYRDLITRELVETERKYVANLENLYDLKKSLEEMDTIPGEKIEQICPKIDAILDFQHRFLSQLETINSMPSSSQHWGTPFLMYEDAFDIYSPIISNHHRATRIIEDVFDKIKLSNHPIATDLHALENFSLSPLSRLAKYPVLLKDLIKRTEDEEMKQELVTGCNTVELVLQKVNEATDRTVLDAALEDLMDRMIDWRQYRVERFGKLILHGTYGILIRDKKKVREYKAYLFENIILCCKEKYPKGLKDQEVKAQSPECRQQDNIGLQLKGRVFMTDMTDVVFTSDPRPYSVQIWWQGPSDAEQFTIAFNNEMVMKKWADAIETQRKKTESCAADAPPR